MQGAHADAEGQLALARGAVEGTFGDVTPGRGEVLQQVQADAVRDFQARLGAILGLGQQEVFADQVHQRLGVDAQGAGEISGNSER